MKYSSIAALAAMCCGSVFGHNAWAAESAGGAASAEVYLVSDRGIGKSVGTVTFTDTADGLRIVTNFHSLPAGLHGFHVHENGSCQPTTQSGNAVPAGAAGGHYDPAKTGTHRGPEGGGHKGDLPALDVAPDGTARKVLTVKNLTAGELKGRAVMIHEGGDNYADMPAQLGGGGSRLACGVIQ